MSTIFRVGPAPISVPRNNEKTIWDTRTPIFPTPSPHTSPTLNPYSGYYGRSSSDSGYFLDSAGTSPSTEYTSAGTCAVGPQSRS